jgi:hypothetical protein
MGQLVQAQVVTTGPQGTMVKIGQQGYLLQLPIDVEAGQTLDLQVFQTTPVLTLRLMTDTNGAPPTATQVNLSHSEALTILAESLPSPSASSAPPLLATPGAANAQDMGRAIATLIQEQFENPQTPGATLAAAGTSSPIDSEGPAFDPTSLSLATLPSTEANSAGGALPASGAANASASLVNDTAHASASSLVAFASGPAAPSSAASAISNPPGSSGQATDAAALAASARPPATASTLSPASWQGQVFPGLAAEVQIEPDHKRAAFDAPSLNAWRATLKLTLPHLGQVNAQVMWNMGGLRIHVDASDAQTAEQLRDGSGDLLETLRSLEMRVQSMGVRHA